MIQFAIDHLLPGYLIIALMLFHLHLLISLHIPPCSLVTVLHYTGPAQLLSTLGQYAFVHALILDTAFPEEVVACLVNLFVINILSNIRSGPFLLLFSLLGQPDALALTLITPLIGALLRPFFRLKLASIGCPHFLQFNMTVIITGPPCISAPRL